MLIDVHRHTKDSGSDEPKGGVSVSLLRSIDHRQRIDRSAVENTYCESLYCFGTTGQEDLCETNVAGVDGYFRISVFILYSYIICSQGIRKVIFRLISGCVLRAGHIGRVCA